MHEMKLQFFTEDENFPFFIHYGKHEEDLFQHKHTDFEELVIVINGNATHRVNQEKFYIKKGDVFVISKDTSHGYENTSNFQICNIMYRSEDLLSSEYDIKKNAGFHALFVLEPYFAKEHSFQSKLTLSPTDFTKIHILIDTMITEYEQKNDGWQTFLKANFMTLVVMLSRLYSFGNNIEKADVIHIANSISYMENHYTEDISIELLARMSHYSPRHFTRVFHETYHTTPLNYILSLRLQQGCFLLKTTKLPISQIALQCGFSDGNYFSRIFKKKLGVVPTQYRLFPER